MLYDPLKKNKQTNSEMMDTWSVGDNPWHPRHPSKEGHHQIWQTGYHDNHQRWPLWKKTPLLHYKVQWFNKDVKKFHWLEWVYLIFPTATVRRLLLSSEMNKTSHYNLPNLFALITCSDAKVPFLFTMVRRIPFSIRMVPSLWNVTQHPS